MNDLAENSRSVGASSRLSRRIRQLARPPSRETAARADRRRCRAGGNGPRCWPDAPRRADACLPGRRPAASGCWRSSFTALRSARNWGHGDFTDLAAAGRHRRRPRRGRHRAQSAARAVSGSRRSRQPLLAEQPAVSQSALHRRRGDPGICRADAAARRRHQRLARQRRSSTTPVWRAPSSRRCAWPTSAFATRRASARADFEAFRASKARRCCASPASKCCGSITGTPWPDGRSRGVVPARDDLRRLSPRASRATANSTNSCNGPPTASSQTCRDAAQASGHADRALYRSSRSASTRTAPTPGAQQDVVLPVCRSARRPTSSIRRVRTGASAPFNPHALAASDFEPMRRLLRAAMRYAGAIRLDHVLGLKRLFMIPHGAERRPGRLCALSVRAAAARGRRREPRHRCIVDRRGSRHRAGRLPRHAGALGPVVLSGHAVRARARRPLSGRRRPIRPKRSRPSTPTTCRAFAAGSTGHDLRVKRGIGVDPGETSDDARGRAQQTCCATCCRNARPNIRPTISPPLPPFSPPRRRGWWRSRSTTCSACVDQVNIPGHDRCSIRTGGASCRSRSRTWHAHDGLRRVSRRLRDRPAAAARSGNRHVPDIALRIRGWCGRTKTSPCARC